VIKSPIGFPAALGDIATGGSATTVLTVDFAGCESDVHFKLRAPWSSATYDTGVFESRLDFWR